MTSITRAARWNLAEYQTREPLELIPLPAQLSGWRCTPELAKVWAAYQRGRMPAAAAKAECKRLMDAELVEEADAAFSVYNADAWIDYAALNAALTEQDAAAGAVVATLRERAATADERTAALYRKAIDLVDRNGLPLVDGDGWAVAGATGVYHTRIDGCDCPAGQHGRRCCHVLIVAAL